MTRLWAPAGLFRDALLRSEEVNMGDSVKRSPATIALGNINLALKHT